MNQGYLFVATSSFAWGEVVFARRIAAELRERGARVIMLAPSKLGPLLDKTQWDRLGFVDQVLATLPATIAQVARSERCETVVLVDIASVFMQLEGLHQDGLLLPTLERAGLRVVGLDVWDLDSTTMRWDFGFGREWIHSRHALAVRHRLRPVPFISPQRPGAYCALPSLKAADRERARAALGLTDERLVLVPTATWQEARNQNFPDNVRLAEHLPRLLGGLLARADAHLRVAHVGPERSNGLHERLGDRYRFFAQMSASSFEELVLASDALVTTNLAATTISTALAADVPILTVINSCAVARMSDVDVSADARPDLEPLLPLDRFRVWPMGLHSFLEPVLHDNPMIGAISVVELLDEARLHTTLHDLLGAGREQARARQRVYREMVLALPTAATLLGGFS